MILDKSNLLYRKAIQAILFGLIIPVDLVFDTILYAAPKDDRWYWIGALIASTFLLGAWRVFRHENVGGFLDLYFYDLLVMIAGGVMWLLRLNPPAPIPLPYQVLILTLLLLKLHFALSFINDMSMVIGPFSYFQRKRHGVPLGVKSVAKFLSVGLLFSVFCYWLLYNYGQESSYVFRGVFGSFWIFVGINYLQSHKGAQNQYQDALDQQNYLMMQMAELEHQLQDQQQLIADDEELIKYFNDADPAYRKLALKLLRANYERNEEMKKQEELRSQGVFTLQGYVKAHNDGQWQQQDGAKA